jgi:hypothetical protein
MLAREKVFFIGGNLVAVITLLIERHARRCRVLQELRCQTLRKPYQKGPAAGDLGRVWRSCLTFVRCSESTLLWRIRNSFWAYRATIGA